MCLNVKTFGAVSQPEGSDMRVNYLPVRTGKAKQPYWFEVNDGELFAFAGMLYGRPARGLSKKRVPGGLAGCLPHFHNFKYDRGRISNCNPHRDCLNR